MKKKIILGILFLITGISIFLALKQTIEKINYKNENTQLAIYLNDEKVDNIPTKESGYYFDLEKSNCSDGAKINWNSITWSPEVKNISATRTKCTLYFTNQPLKDYGIYDTIVTNRDGLYGINHDDAVITSVLTAEEKENLRKTEYRYAGKEVSNYFVFNEEIWRMIGLVNTPEGSRIKLVRQESIGNYSWDTSNIDVNNGWGINEWSEADLMRLLNEGAYWNRTNGVCYNGENNSSIACDFSTTGLTSLAKEMIETITWNTGSLFDTKDKTINEFYNMERSNKIGTSCFNQVFCNDTVVRTTTWKGKVGLIYPSDQGYSTAKTDTISREECLSSGYNLGKCSISSWLGAREYQFTITPTDHDSAYNSFVAHVSDGGSIYGNGPTRTNWASYPTVYLKTNVIAKSGDGTLANPYLLEFI